MIELRHLSHLLVACENDNLTRSAEDLSVAPSTLSGSLKALETELGHSLFKRSGSGTYPQTCARWLFRAALPLLLLERHVRRRLKSADEAQVLTVNIGLKFTIGKASKALLRAIAETEWAEPLLLIHPVWIDDDPSPFDGGWPEDVGLKDAGAITLQMTTTGQPTASNEVELMRDRWVLAYRVACDGAAPPDLDSRTVLVPTLSRGISEAVEAHVVECGFRRVSLLTDHPGSLPRLMSEYPEAAFLVPGSALAERLGLISTASTPVTPALFTTLIGRADPNNEPAQRFLKRLECALAEPEVMTELAPKLTSRRVRYFNLTHKLRSVSAAARLANIAQPALSEQLRKLELTLETRLFDRRSSGVSPTAQSARFAPVSQALENGLCQLKIGAMSSFSAQTPRLVLGVLPSVSQHSLLVNRIAEALLALKAQYPKTHVTVREAPNGTLQDWVLRGKVGLSIVETGPPQLPRFPLGASEDLALIANPRFHIVAAGTVQFCDLVKFPIALPTSRFGLRQLLDSAARSQRIELRPLMEIDALPMLMAISRQQPICTILPPSAVSRELESGELTAHPIVGPCVARRLFVIYSGERSLAVPERTFVSLLKEGLAVQKSCLGASNT
jgi:LysR family transcriptional regulator, nitrogen assimilation regulatory protein